MSGHFFRQIFTLILILKSLCSFLYGNFSFDDELNSEQKIHLLEICEIINKISYEKLIKIVTPSGETHQARINSIIKFYGNYKAKNLNHEESFKLIKPKGNIFIKEVKDIHFFIFSIKDGKRIAKFSCNGLAPGRQKLGPFLIPSNKTHILNPVLKFY